MRGCKDLMWLGQSQERLYTIARHQGQVLIPVTAQIIFSWVLPVNAASSLRELISGEGSYASAFLVGSQSLRFLRHITRT